MLDMLFVAFADVGHAVCGLCRCWTCCLWPLPMLDMLFMAFAYFAPKDLDYLTFQSFDFNLRHILLI
jgi:hypothetical protein